MHDIAFTVGSIMVEKETSFSMPGFPTRMEPRRFRSALSVGRRLTAFLIFALTVSPLIARAQEPAPADTAEAHLGKGYEAVKDERYQVAAKEFQAALALNPGLVRGRYQLAVCWFALGKTQEARQELERLEKETRGDASVTYQLARVDLRDGDFETAIKRLVLLVNDPPFPDTAYYLGTAYLQKGELVAAEKWLQVAARRDPRDYRVPEHLARTYQRQGRKAEAEKQFARSSQLRQRYDQASQQAAACSQLLETKSVEEAKPACEQLFDPHDPDRLTTLGLLYGQHGRYEEAVKPLEEACGLDPDSFEINHDLGLSYFRLQRYREARRPLEKAVALRPDFFGSNALLGATLYMQGEDEAAYGVLDHAHALNPEDRDTADLLFKEALILASKEETQKRYTSALTYLRTAGRLQPQDQDVQARISELLRHASHPPAQKRPEKDTPQ
jgi:tetratricopeptide (TPR) repeat protein